MRRALQPARVSGACRASSQPGLELRRVAEFPDKLRLGAWSELCDEGELNEDVQSLDLLVHRGAFVPSSLFCGLIKRCTPSNLVVGEVVHALAVRNGYQSDRFLANHVIGMYACHGRLQEAFHVFRKLAAPNAHSWSSIILAHVEHGQSTQAVKLYLQMQQSRVMPDNHVFVAVLKACACAADLVSGRRVHADLLRSAAEHDVFVGSCLVDMYAKCGSLEDARRVFDDSATRNVVTWTAMLAGYAEHGLAQEALALYGRMEEEGLTPADPVTFVCLLKACASTGALQEGKQLHRQIQERGLEADVIVGSCLVDLYAKCGSLQDARQVFDKMETRNVVTWTAMLAGYAQQGLGQETLALYADMQKEAATPADRVTLICLLKACATLGALDMGKQLHAQAKEKSLQADVVVGSCLVDMYAKCGSLVDARRVFDNLTSRNVVTWTCMLAGYAEQGLGQEALALYSQMQDEGLTPSDKITFVCLLKACNSIGALHQGIQLHSQIRERGLDADEVVGSCLVDMYVKCDHLDDARMVFDSLPTRSVVTWNAMLAGYAEHGLGEEALDLYATMQQEGIPPADRVTFVCLLKACASIGALDMGKQLHAQVLENGFESDVVLGSCLVDMYAKCGSLDKARSVFNHLEATNLVTWNAMLGGYVLHGLFQEALVLSKSMEHECTSPADHATFVCLLKACANLGALDEGKQLHTQFQERGLELDVAVGSCLVEMYAKCGSLDDARKVFDNLATKDVVSWSSMLKGYCDHGLGQEALALHAMMQEEAITPADHVTFVSLLKACGSIGALHQGKQLHSQIRERELESDVVITNCLVDMYAKCGSLEDASQVFKTLKTRDVVTWTVMITAYGQHGLAQEALQCYQEMQLSGVNPTGITFVSLLSACSHAGLLDEGIAFFESMCTDHGITPEINHYVSMIDLFGRAGCFRRVEEILSSMPMQPDLPTWMCLLAACRKHGNIVMGEQAFSSAVRLQPNHAAAYVLMSQIYADAGLIGRADEVAKSRIRARVWKEPGRTWIVHRHHKHTFQVGDCPDRELHELLRGVHLVLKTQTF